jgi:hypothetical protein
MKLFIAVIVIALAIPATAQERQSGWTDVIALAIQHSALTLPGSKPFHLKAEIVESTNPDSGYKGKFELYWVSPEKWRRTIESPDFSQTKVMNGDKVFEQDIGDYFPWWLNNLITATLDPWPGFVMPDRINEQAGSNLNPQISSVCPGTKIGNDRWSFCIEPRRMLLTSAFDLNSSFGAEFNNFSEFGRKQVARQITMTPEPGTTIQATITQLTELRQPDETLFAIEKSTPQEGRIDSLRVSEETLRGLSLTSTEIEWPTVEGGLLTGGCAVFVSADRSGHMREVWPGGCDNNELMTPLREMVRRWQLKTATVNGVPVQVQARLTFPVKTTLKSKSKTN